MVQPDLIVCDEPVSALDVSVQAQILNLLGSLKQRFSLTLLFIAHDLAVVKQISDRVAVMYLGRFCEVAATNVLYAAPRHPYTAMLLEAVPSVDPRVELSPVPISGEIPSPIDPPSGCRFRTRCPCAQERCTHEVPELRELNNAHWVACHFPLEPVPDEEV